MDAQEVWIEPRDRERPTIDRESTSLVPDPRIYDSVHICRLRAPFYLTRLSGRHRVEIE